LFFYFLLIKLVPETIRSKKKVAFIFHPSFYVPVQKDPGSCAFLPPGIRIRDEKCRGADPG
jgi:hypothetical protein